MHGLTSGQWKQLYHILDEHRDDIRWVKLFGVTTLGRDYTISFLFTDFLYTTESLP